MHVKVEHNIGASGFFFLPIFTKRTHATEKKPDRYKIETKNGTEQRAVKLKTKKKKNRRSGATIS